MKKLLFCLLVLAIFLPGTGRAQQVGNCPAGQYCLLEPLPVINGVTPAQGCLIGDENNKSSVKMLKCVNMNNFVEYVFKFMIALAVFLSIVMIIYGGFTKMLSETPFKKLHAKTTINNAIFGLIAALTSYLILQTIDPRLIQVNTKIEGICSDTDTTALCERGTLDNFRKSAMTQENRIQRFEKLSANQKTKAKELDQKIQTLEESRKALAEDLKLGKITSEEYEKKIKTLELEKTGVVIDRTQVDAEYSAIEIQRGLEGMFFDPAVRADMDGVKAYTDWDNSDKLVNGKRPTNTKNIIQNQFNEDINKILSIQPLTNKSTVAVAKLNQQKVFYVDLASDDLQLSKEVHGSVVGYSTTAKLFLPYTIILDSQAKANREALIAKKAKYTELMNDETKISNSGLTAPRYKEILQGRINQINAVLPKQN